MLVTSGKQVKSIWAPLLKYDGFHPFSRHALNAAAVPSFIGVGLQPIRNNNGMSMNSFFILQLPL